MMLADAGRELGGQVVVLGETSMEPALSHGDGAIVGSFQEESSFLELFSRCDVVAFESEFSNTPALKKVSKSFPHIKGLHLEALDHLADKLRQKQLLVDQAIPTAEHTVFTGTPESWLLQLKSLYPPGCMLKWAKGGYDGKGNFLWRHQADKYEAALEFISGALERKIDIYAEELISFAQEFAVVTARGLSGASESYPPIVTVQEDGICVQVKGPAVSWGLPEECAVQATDIAQKIGNKVGLYGVFAVEFFFSKEGKILVNEIAPRVHNSGHFSLGAAKISQFAAHWLCLLDQDLPSWGCKPFYGMLNVLGPAGFKGKGAPLVYESPGIVSYWYEKLESRPGRKMGHMVIFGDSKEEFQLRWNQGTQVLNDWHASYGA
jgi:phosphoribosylaminoimidazole carboxylase PurK protein